MASAKVTPSNNYLLDFSFKQTNLLYIQDFLRFTNTYNPDTLFVIEGWKITEEDIIKYKIHPELISITGELSTRTRIVKGSHELFLQLCKDDREVHLLEFIEEYSCFKWLEASAGADVSVLREHTLSYHSTNNIQDFVLKYDRPVTIIFADNGMGKTTLLNHVRRELTAQNENKFLLYLDDIKLRTFYTSCSSANVVDFIEFFTVDLTNSDIHIMYDNFERLKERDVIIDIMTKIHLKYRHVKQWITCSDVECRNKLESRLGTFACSLEPVSQVSQMKYLKNIWDIKHDDLDEMIESILDQWKRQNSKGKFNSKYTDPFNNFSTYPLHLKMIAATFTPSYELELNNVTILDVYKDFVKSTYSNDDIEESAVQKLFEYINHEFKFKTNVNLTPEALHFVNVTNYLAAKWFSRNYHDHRSDLKLLLNSRGNWSFQYFFNSFLCLGKQLHSEALNAWINYNVGSTLALNRRDAGGRTALQLFGNSLHFMRYLLTRGALMNVKDNVLQWTPLQYCDYNGHLDCLNDLLERGADPRQLTWTLSLSEEEISNRFEYASMADPQLTLYIKFICENVKKFQVTPKIIGNLYKNLPPDVTMMVLNHAKKSSIHYVNSDGQTALFKAVSCNHFDAVKFFIHNLGFDIYHRCYADKTVFHLACKKRCTDIAKYFLHLGVDVNVTHGNNNSNAFTDCCEDNNLEVMTFLIENGADVNVTLKSGKTPLELACKHGSMDVVTYLCKNAAELKINYSIHNENLPYLLYDAIDYGFTELVEFLLNVNKKKIININVKIDGTTLLHMACRSDDYDGYLVPLFIQAGADVNATDDNGCTPVFDLLKSDNPSAVKFLVDSGCNLSHVNNDGETVLHVFTKNCLETNSGSQYDYFELVYLIRELITYGADVNARTPSGDTPLHFACRHSNITVIRCLVSQGADIHVINDNGETPLHLGCITECTKYRNIDFKTIKYLVFKGADINARTNSGKTPIMYALSIPANIRTVLNLGADVHCKDKDNKTLVHYFAEHNLLNELKVLAMQGVKDAKSTDSDGQTALHIAARKNHFECFKYLIKYFETDVNIVDNNGKTATDLLHASTQ